MIAPLIVRAIDSTRSKDAVYSEIWTSYLSGCLSLYENNRYEECKDAYTKMVEDLREKWL
jgi:hypothetical protein